MVRKFFGKFVPSKSWFDANGDGNVDYKDFIAAAQNALDAVTPSKAVLDINGDGVVDINDALDAARITGATIAGAGVTVGAGAVAGSILVTGKATAIATVISSSLGAAAGGAMGVIFGPMTVTSISAMQFVNGSWFVASKTIMSSSPAFVSAMSSISSYTTGTSSTIVNTIAGFPIVEATAVKSLVASKQIIVIAGIPIAREVAIATGLVALVVVGGYSYYVLTRKRVEADEVQKIADAAPAQI